MEVEGALLAGDAGESSEVAVVCRWMGEQSTLRPGGSWRGLVSCVHLCGHAGLLVPRYTQWQSSAVVAAMVLGVPTLSGGFRLHGKGGVVFRTRDLHT